MMPSTRMKQSKLYLYAIIAAIVMCIGVVAAAYQGENDKVEVVRLFADQEKNILEVPVQKVNATYLVAIKPILIQANLEVSEVNGKITATDGKKNIAINPNTGKAQINSRIVTLPNETKVIDGEVFVPTTFVEEACLFDVETNENVITLSTRPNSMYYVTGELQYQGDLSNEGKRNGYGVEYASTGDVMYKGEWQNDIKQGTGTFIWENKDKYTGAIKNGEANGKGTLTHYGVGTYVGLFVNGKRSGKGTFTWQNGDKYIGDWSNDKMNGTGTYRFAKGTSYTATWKNNKMVKVIKKINK